MNFSDYLPQQYRLVQLIGRGNFTNVYKAWSAHLERHVVVIVPHSPSTKDDKAEIVLQHFSTSYPSLPLNTPEITPALRHVLSRALARNPEERFASIQEFVVALDHNNTVLGRKH